MNATDETKRYNGWTNYETWNIKLWMDNEEGTYNYWRERAQEVFDAAEADKYNTRDERATLDLAEALKDEHEEAMHQMLDAAKQSATVWADLLGAALSEVNWYEIAEGMIDEDVEKPTDADGFVIEE